MPAINLSFRFLTHRSAQILTAVLLLQVAVFYGFSRSEKVPAIAPLSTFAATLGSWHLVQENAVEQEIQDVLRADDILSRIYQDSASGRSLSLFFAYFKSQRTGKTPHSPKNCLPGSGWAPIQSGTVSVPLPQSADSITVNEYIVSRGDDRSVVFYWYQSGTRVVASEFAAKGYLVLDSIRYNRSDTALLRVVVPCRAGEDQQAVRAGIEFIQTLFGPVRQILTP